MNTAAKKIGQKVANVRDSQSPKVSCTKQSISKRIVLLKDSMEYKIFGGKSVEVLEVQD